VKRTKDDVTYAELDAAIGAVCDEMGDCKATKTLQRFYYRQSNDDDAVVTFDGPAPVTLTQFDDAFSEAQGLGLPTGTLEPLARVRALLASAEVQKAKADSVPVTRAEFDAFADAVARALVAIDDRVHDPHAGTIDVRLRAAAQSDESASAGILALLRRIASAREAEGDRQRSRGRRSPGQPWSVR
jgi:hypothetical protein